MSEPSRNRALFLRLVVVAFVITAVVSIVWLGRALAAGDAAWGSVAAFFGISLVLERDRALMRDSFQASLSGLATFTAAIVGGLPLAIAAGLGAAAGSVLAGKKPRIPIKMAFNAGMFVTVSALCGAVYAALATPGDSAVIAGREGLVAVAAAVVAYTLVNNAAVATVIYLASGERIRSTLRSIGPAIPAQVFYAGLSVVAAVMILEVHWATLVLLIIPTMVARSGLLGFQEHDASFERLARTIAKAIELKDPYTRGHGDRVAELTVAVAAAKGYDYQQLRMARYAALLHDVGKIIVPLRVISKPGALTDEEFDEIRKHPAAGAEILDEIDFLRPALDAVRFHHERLDGRGYPYGLEGIEVPEVARIVTVVDAFDAMTSTRSYRHARPVEQAFTELRRCAGPQFDADIVELAIEVITRLDWQPTYGMPTSDDILDDLESHFDARPPAIATVESVTAAAVIASAAAAS